MTAPTQQNDGEASPSFSSHAWALNRCMYVTTHATFSKVNYNISQVAAVQQKILKSEHTASKAAIQGRWAQ